MIKQTMKKQQRMQLHYSSFKFPLTRAKSYFYSTTDSSLVQLSEDIDFIYNDLKSTRHFNMSQEELIALQQMLLSGFYTISPLRLRRIRRDDLKDFLLAMLPDFPDITFYPSSDSDFYIVVFPSKKEDALVFMVLAIHLYRYTFGSVPENNYRLIDRVDQFYSSIKKMGKANKLHLINMDGGEVFPDCRVLDVVKSFVGANSVCYKLVSSFLKLDTLDEEGRKVHFYGIPVMGDITRVLFNLAFFEFDKRLRQMYPGIVYERFIGMVFIASTDDIRIDDYQLYEIYDMILDIGLTGEIDYIVPARALECRDIMVGLDHDGKVVVDTPTPTNTDTDYG